MSKVETIDLSKYDTFLFDLYGTLFDLHTDEYCAKTWKKWLKWLDANNIKHPDYIHMRAEFFKWDRLFRRKAQAEKKYEVPEIDVIDIYRYMFEEYGNHDLSDEIIWEASYAFRTSSMEYIRLFPGVMEYLDMLHKEGKKAYLLSNAQASYTRPELKEFGLDKALDGIYISSDYFVMKPDKAFFNIAIDDLGLDKTRTIMVGDSAENDVAGALAAGIDAYQIRFGDLFVK